MDKTRRSPKKKRLKLLIVGVCISIGFSFLQFPSVPAAASEEVYYETLSFEDEAPIKVIIKDSKIIPYDDDNDEVSVKEKKGNNSKETKKINKIEIIDGVNNIYENDGTSDAFKEGKEFYIKGYSQKVVYIEEDNKTKKQRKLTVGEYDKIKKYKEENGIKVEQSLATSLYESAKDLFTPQVVSAASSTKTIYQLTLKVSQTQDIATTKNTFWLMGTATWSGTGGKLFTPNSQEPSAG